MKKHLILVVVLTFCFLPTVFGQSPQIPKVNHYVHKINSQILGEDRTF